MDEYIKQFNKNTNDNRKPVAEKILNKTYLKILSINVPNFSALNPTASLCILAIQCYFKTY